MTSNNLHKWGGNSDQGGPRSGKTRLTSFHLLCSSAGTEKAKVSKALGGEDGALQSRQTQTPYLFLNFSKNSGSSLQRLYIPSVFVVEPLPPLTLHPSLDSWEGQYQESSRKRATGYCVLGGHSCSCLRLRLRNGPMIRNPTETRQVPHTGNRKPK